MDYSSLFYLTGVYSIGLGILHFFMPSILDFDRAIPKEGPPIKPIHLGLFQYDTQRSDVHGIAYVMNHCVSFVIVSVGCLDLTLLKWWNSPFGQTIMLWIAAWWLLRAGTQFYLGSRKGDWFWFCWFSIIGGVHVGALHWLSP